MNGRTEFTRDEIDELYRLVRLKRGASASKQKHLRAEMRRVGFYMSDFGFQGQGFRESDLDHLLKKGRLTIIGEEEPFGWWGRLRRKLARVWA